MLPPNLYLIGTQKGGTTFLATLLGQHPEVCLADPKEPDFYTKHWDKGLAWYQQCFAAPEAKYLLDASTSYSSAMVNPRSPDDPFGGVPEKIHGVAPGAKFIYILRNPVKRTHSSYWHSIRGGYEDKPFREALESNSYYLRLGQYHDQLQLYLDLFERDAIHILLFEEFIRAPKEYTNACLAFLDLPPLPDYTLDSGRNESFQYRSFFNIFNKMLAPAGGLNKVAKTVKPWLPNWLVHTAYRVMAKDVEALTPEDADFLKAYFQPHNARLRDVFGVSIDAWR